MPEAYLRKVHLVSAQIQANGKTVVPGSARPLSRRIVYKPSKIGDSLYITDEMGCLKSVRSDFEPFPANVSLGQKLEMHLVPSELVPLAHFRFGPDWQGQMLRQIQALNLDKPEKPRLFALKSSDFEMPKFEASVRDYYQKQSECRCLVLPRLRQVCLVVDKRLLPEFVVTNKTQLIINGKSADLVCGDSDLLGAFIAVSKPEFTDIPEGLAKFRFESKDGKVIYQGFVTIHFSTQSSAGDFNLHYLHSNSIEETLIRSFAQRYEHLNRTFYEEKDAQAQGKSDAPPLAVKKIIPRIKTTQKVAKLATGFINCDEDELFQHILGKQWDIISAELGKSNPFVQIVNDSWNAYSYFKEFPKKWKELRTKLDIADKVSSNYKVLTQVIDGNFLKKAYRATAMQYFAIDQLAKEAAAGKTSHYTARLASSNLKAYEAEMIMGIGVTKKATEVDKLFNGKGKMATQSLALLNIAMTAEGLVSAWKEVYDVSRHEGLARDRFDEACGNYRNKFGESWNFEAEKTLEAFRQALDGHSLKLDEKQREALAASLEMLLNLSVFVPVVGEIGGMILLVKEGVEVATSAGKSLGGYLDRKYFHSLFADYFARQDRASALWELGMVNARAIWSRQRGKSPEELDKDIELQYRLRLHVLIGLVELIDRCGTRFEDAGSKSGKFEEKVKEYAISEYITHFILNGNKDVPVQLGVSLAQAWMWCRGNKVEKWQHIYTSKGFLKNGFRLHFQKSFPIHVRESQNSEDFARAFCVNYSGARKVGKFSLHIQTMSGGKWQTLSGTVQNPATITAVDSVRCLLEFDGQGDFSGLPVSLQCIRTDTFPDTEGPIYKGYFVSYEAFLRLDENEMNAPLKSAVDSKSSGGAKKFVCDLRPFYFFRNEPRLGFKPFGFIAIAANPCMEMSFVAKIGDTAFEEGDYTMHPPKLNVAVPWKDPLCAEMVLDRKFLENKTSENRYDPLFINFQKPPRILGLWVNAGKGFKVLSQPGGGTEFTASMTSHFSWNAPFTMVILIGAPYVTDMYKGRHPVKVPGKIAVKELSGIDTAGPEYDVDIVEILSNQSKDPGQFKGDFNALMKAVSPRSVLLQPSETLPNISIGSADSMHLYGIRLEAKFQVEDDANEFVSFDGLKPFGGRLLRPGQSGSYRFAFSLNALEPIGLNMNDFLELEVPGFQESDLKSRTFINEKFVTNSLLTKELKMPRKGFR